MMWGCMSYEGIGYGCHIQETMNADIFIEVLENAFQDSLDYWGLHDGDFIFQQDNDPKHTSKKAKKWFEDHNITVLDWPAQSPDLNPIEHIWHQLKIKLSRYETNAKGVHELWERCDREWNTFTTETCRKYIDTMPARVQAVLKAKGCSTNF
jgi:hypothetical protein